MVLPFKAKYLNNSRKTMLLDTTAKHLYIQKRMPLQKTLRVFDVLFYTRKLYAPFMNKSFRKAIYTRSRLQNNFNKNSTNENKVRYKKQ